MLIAADIRKEEKVMAALREMYTLWGLNPPEEVYYECRAGLAHLYLCDDEAFIILKERTENDLFIWIAYGFNNGGGLIDKYVPEIEELGRKIGAKTLSFQTPRKGFDKVLSNRWKGRFIEYSMRIDEQTQEA